MPKQGWRAAAGAMAVSLLCACAQTTAPPLAGPGSGQSILQRTSPAAGTTVSSPIDKIELWFSPPARLGEVTVTGPHGQMPMMVTAVGEVGYYSLPLSSAGPGHYTVTWKALSGGREHSGNFEFDVR